LGKNLVVADLLLVAGIYVGSFDAQLRNLFSAYSWRGGIIRHYTPAGAFGYFLASGN
jgi:hypothetical protein